MWLHFVLVLFCMIVLKRKKYRNYTTTLCSIPTKTWCHMRVMDIQSTGNLFSGLFRPTKKKKISLYTIGLLWGFPSQMQKVFSYHDAIMTIQETRHCLDAIMMTSSNGNIFRITGPLCGEFTGPGEFPTQRPVTRSFDVSFDLCLNKRLSKQPWGWWFETP